MNRIRCVLRLGWLALSLGIALVPSVPAGGQEHVHGQAGPASAPPASTRITMEALHAAGGIPPGWRFTLPAGDATAGRQAFVALKCYACHAVASEQFPLKPGETATAGPELTGMGGIHPAEYLAESIINPSAVLIEGPGYIGGDGRSIMPSYPEMTLAQLTNLVAYLRTLTSPEAMPGHHPAYEKVVGSYRVRLVYKTETAAEMHHGHGGAMPMPMGQAQGRLLVFLLDRASGQPIPYAPVSATIEVSGKPAHTVKLSPWLGQEGFYYGADLMLPADTSRIMLTIGPTTIGLAPGAPEGLKQAQTAAFDWK
jgi:cytochrome c